MIKLDRQGQVVTLAMMIAGIVLSRKGQLSEMSSEIPTTTQERSVEMRMRRWVKESWMWYTCPLPVKFWKFCAICLWC